jgi:hypothetical protein
VTTNIFTKKRRQKDYMNSLIFSAVTSWYSSLAAVVVPGDPGFASLPCGELDIGK